jgi:3-dehydroquinate synthase
MPPAAVSGLRVADALPLPAAGATLAGHAARTDTYPIAVVQGVEDVAARVAELAGGASVTVIADETVEALYGGTVLRGLREAGVDPLVHTVAEGERSKSLESAVRLWDALAQSQLARRDLVVNLGGGVIADLGGWVASGYMRGVPYVNVPTTLLAQVDGALGGRSRSTTRSPRTCSAPSTSRLGWSRRSRFWTRSATATCAPASRRRSRRRSSRRPPTSS